MPLRKTPLVNGQYYHIFNRGVNKQPIFFVKRHYERAIETIKYYLTAKPPLRYSKFICLSKMNREILLKEISHLEKQVDLIAYCLMPNHFHLLLKQNIDDGISEFVKRFQISYTLFFNTKHKREGPLLNGQFKAVLIEDDNQLLHLSRYIHLNPHTSYKVRNLFQLLNYEWSSFPEYLKKTQNEICSKDIILTLFKSNELYKEFVLDNADFQRKLGNIKHLLLE